MQRFYDFPELMKYTEVMSVLGVSRRTIQRMVKRGEFRLTRVGKRGSPRFLRDSVLQYLSERVEN